MGAGKGRSKMANSIEFARNYVSVIDKVYQRAAVSHVLNSGPAWCARATTLRRS